MCPDASMCNLTPGIIAEVTLEKQVKERRRSIRFKVDCTLGECKQELAILGRQLKDKISRADYTVHGNLKSAIAWSNDRKV